MSPLSRCLVALPSFPSFLVPPRVSSLRWGCRCRPLSHLFHDSDEDEQVLGLASFSDQQPSRFHVLGLGQAMVDFSGMVDDAFIDSLGLELEKGSRKVVNHEERGRVLRAMDGRSYKAAAGGSLSNTLVALARMATPELQLKVAMAASVGTDPLGAFYRSKLGRANVHVVCGPIPGATTGTVIVLTTPDAQRTMLSYRGTSSTLHYDPALIANSNILVVEGYLLEVPHTIHAVQQACLQARRSRSLVAVTASDVSCIHSHLHHFWDILGKYADIVFANCDEARALCAFSSDADTASASASGAARYLSRFVPLVSVTDGPRGSYIGVKGEAIYIPPCECVEVDTCGAGDAYASGILYGILRGASDLRGMGLLAARIAATVVAQQGTRLTARDAAHLAHSFSFHPDDVGSSDHISSF